MANAKVNGRNQDAYISNLPNYDVAPLWTAMSKMVPPHPNPATKPAIWKYETMRPLLMEAGELVGAEEAERRVLMLVNPGSDAPNTTNTIYGGLQLILPGETAPAHRHVAFALRFIIEGRQGFTAVEGQKIMMEPGDVILTPSWHWHDHGNDGNEAVIWLDGLNLPLLKYAPVNFAENYKESRYPSDIKPDSEWRFPWSDVTAAFEKESGPHRIYHYKTRSGNTLSTTVGAQAEMIEAGHSTSPQQATYSYIYHCYGGQGKSIIKAPGGSKTVFEWRKRDTFAVPAWHEIQHINTSSEAAYFFVINDRPFIDALGLSYAAGQKRELDGN